MAADGRITIQEQASNIPRGVLTELWRRDEPLPRISGAGLGAYYLNRGIRTLTSLPMSSTITIMTIAVSIFLFAGFLLILQNVDKVITEAGNSLYVTAYLKDNITEHKLREFIRKVESSNWVRSVRYITKEQALKMFREDLGERGDFLQGLDRDNPLPSSLDIVLHPDELGIGNVEKIVKRLRANPLIDEVIYGSEWVDKVQNVLRIFRIFGYITLFIVLAVIMFLIANTIKLVIYSRQDEIEIMQLVGATSGFVKLPFIIGGVIQGFIGSVLGLMLLLGGYWIINHELRYSTLLGVALPELEFLGLFVCAAIIILGLLIGAFGSFFALGRFIHV